jgi:hypothetical protein
MNDADEELIIAQEQRLLMGRLKSMLGRKIERGAFDFAADAIAESRTKLKRRYNIDMPPLVAFVVPSVGLVHITREDRDADYIERLVIQTARTFPNVSAAEIAAALAAAFPKYRPRRQIVGEFLEGQ